MAQNWFPSFTSWVLAIVVGSEMVCRRMVDSTTTSGYQSVWILIRGESNGMGSADDLHVRMSVSAYATWEREHVERHEFFDGKVVSRAGGTRRHSLIGTQCGSCNRRSVVWSLPGARPRHACVDRSNWLPSVP